MNTMIHRAIACLPGLLLAATAVVQSGCQEPKTMEQQVDELYNRMSPEERIAQLRSMYMDDLFGPDGRLDTARCRQLIPNGIGHFSQFAMQQPRDPNELRDRVAAVQHWLISNTPNGIPALFHEEVLSGVNTLGATIYPQQIGQACSFNPELAELKTRQTSTLLRRMGGVLALSPMVDVCRTPSFNRLEESYGEDAYLSAVMGTAFVRGLQQGDLRRGVGACSKHYLGYGGGGDADERELMEEILLPHEAMIRLAGCRAVMPGYHDVHGTRCAANSEILNDILRGYLGFDGMVVSDYTAIRQLPGLDSPAARAAAAINGGCDVDFPEGADYQHLQQTVDSGLVAPAVLERAVKDVLRFKMRAGLLDDDRYLYDTANIALDSPEERQTAYDIAAQSVVLLQNDGVLPLRGAQRVLLTGPNANSIWAMCGDYTYPAMAYFWKRVDDVAEHDRPHIVRLLEGMTSQKPEGLNLMYSRGCDWTEEIETRYGEAGDERAWEYELLHRKVDAGERADAREALDMARRADVIVAAMGENVMLCGENRDRRGLRLPGRQEDFVRQLIQTGKPVVLVMFGGRAQVVAGLAEQCAAVVQAWYPGEEGGRAVADILYGRVSPSAKLSVSYPASELSHPICYNYQSALSDSLAAIESVNGKSVNVRILWPFGHGLSYTTFAYSRLQVDSTVATDADAVSVSFDVENTGRVAADEVAQVYLSPSDAAQPLRPIQLQGFARVSLQPGERRTVSVRLHPEQFGYYSSDGSSQPGESVARDGVGPSEPESSTTRGGRRQWNILPGRYVVKVGASSADIRLEAAVVLTGRPVVKPLREHYFASVSIR